MAEVGGDDVTSEVAVEGQFQLQMVLARSGDRNHRHLVVAEDEEILLVGPGDRLDRRDADIEDGPAAARDVRDRDPRPMETLHGERDLRAVR
jgi:hypothetical protein